MKYFLRNIKKCKNIEETLVENKPTRNFKPNLSSFLSSKNNKLEDKIRILVIHMITNNLTIGDLKTTIDKEEISSEEKSEILEVLETVAKYRLANVESKKMMHSLKNILNKSEDPYTFVPFIKLLGESTINQNSAQSMFESVIDEKKLRRVSSLNFHDIKNVIFFMTDFTTPSEISSVRSLRREFQGCSFYLGSFTVHTANSLIKKLKEEQTAFQKNNQH